MTAAQDPMLDSGRPAGRSELWWQLWEQSWADVGVDEDRDCGHRVALRKVCDDCLGRQRQRLAELVDAERRRRAQPPASAAATVAKLAVMEDAMSTTHADRSLAEALGHAIEAHIALSEAVGRHIDAVGARNTGSALGVAHGTAHRWRTETPGAAALIAARDALRSHAG